MSDDRTIRIEIIAGGGGESSSNGDSKKSGGLGNLTRVLHPVRHLLSEVTEKNEMVGYFAAETVRSINKAAKSEINRYYTLREDYLSQRTIENVNVALNKVQTLGTSILNGASAGSFGGPVGAVAGVVAGAGFWTINELIGMRSAGSNYYQQLNSANFQTSFSQVRAGLIDNGRGTEN